MRRLLLIAYCLLRSIFPPPRHVIDTRQLVEVRFQYRPVILCWFPQTIAAHELINLGGAVQHCLHITRRRLMMIEIIMQRLRLLIEFFDESVYVVLAPRTVEAALIQRRVQTLAKDVGLMLDAMNNLFDLFVGHAIRNVAHNRRDGAATPPPRYV